LEASLGLPEAETHWQRYIGNDATANRGKYDGAIISTQLTGWQREQ
jgi:hypothetical protein